MDRYQGLVTKLLVTAPLLVACFGSLVYVCYGLTNKSVWLVIILTIIALIFFAKNNKEHDETSILSLGNIKTQEWWIFTLFFLSWLISLYLLWSASSDRAIITPWQVVSHWYFITFSLGTILLFLLVRVSSRLTKYALIMQALLLFGVAAIVYRIGFGFDPFVHEAAIKAIMQLGQIKPLTPYYLGHYSLIIVLKTLSGLSIHFWSRILIPGLAALLFPLLVTRWLSHHHGTEKNWLAPALMLFILPASLFIVSTPQSLAYIFLMIVILWPTPRFKLPDKIIISLAALAALVTQPIAGLAACLIVIYDLTKNLKYAKQIYRFIIFFLILAIPLALALVSRFDSATSSSLVWPRLLWLLDYLPQNPSKSSIWLNFSYLFNGLQGLLTASLALGGGIIAFSRKSKELRQRYLWPSLALILASILASALNFHFLIDYERSDFPQRILITAFIVALPLIITSLKKLAQALNNSSRLIMISIIIIFCAAITANLYLSYPRYDDFNNSHSYATSTADILASRWIEEDANNQPYLVLANQQVSAAALREFGFAHYLKNDLFYYPVPTGGPLYPFYLSMVEKPQRATILNAMELAGVNKAYFVLNNYWWRFKYLAPAIQKIADSSEVIGDGQDIIYSFTKN